MPDSQSNPLCCSFKAWHFRTMLQLIQMYKCINEDLAVNGMEMRVNSIRVVITACLNASQISRIGVAMNRSAGGGGAQADPVGAG